MKKIFAVILAAALCAAMSVTTFAASPITIAGGSDSHEVKGTYSAGGAASVVYSVDITWGDMEFTYTDASDGTWNPATHSYSGSTPAGWTVDNTDGNKITVTNHSNAAIKADLSFTSSSGITAQFVETTASTTPVTALNIASAAPIGDATIGQAQTDEAYLKITGGTLDASTIAGSVIGTVTVTLGN